ncbi:hypothetical protein L6452_40311 [Arctium lappa]|uniref:Uncharacterized protein n=1 Tax=Arctium lappa TaxID=4217 RepID=A0ACB8XLX5_ARCLA|nr:hypothetical protein L6452_40311 [Arctium lappa]
MNAKSKNEICTFRQTDDESVPDAWDRYKELLRKCPHHGIPYCIQLETFYSGLNTAAKQMFDATAHGAFTACTYNEGYEILERISNNNGQWVDPRALPRKTAGVQDTDVYALLSSQLANMASLIKTLMLCKLILWHLPLLFSLYNVLIVERVITLNIVLEIPKDVSTGPGNIVGPIDTPLLPKKSDYPTLFPNEPKVDQKENEQTVLDVSQSGDSPKIPCDDRPVEPVKITPSTKVDKILPTVPTPTPQKTTSPTPVPLYIPYLRRLRNQRDELQFKKFLDFFKQLHINIPLVEAIEQMPNYAKFLKDILSKKKRLNEYKTIALTEKCSAMLFSKIPPKLKDPGTFTIPCSIGGKEVGKALCDLGASINLMPSSVFNTLVIGEARPITVSLLLAEKSIAWPKDQSFGEVLGMEESDNEEDTSEFEELEDIQVTSDVEILHSEDRKTLIPSIECAPDLELKQLPSHLKYDFLGELGKLPVIISSSLESDQEEKLIAMLKLHTKAIGWTIADLKGISPTICSRICMDYRKLNQATQKDHFPLPFIDQMLDRLAGKKFYCFLDGYSSYNQIAIAPEDQEKTTFTCPYGTFAFRRMPFGLCNAPATFQRCMMFIFSDMLEQSMEIFMDDFSVYGTLYDLCLQNLEKSLKRCEETDLVLNWEKCHFMVKEGIVLGHLISNRGIEVDKAKLEVIAKLPEPTTVKGIIRSFLRHTGFYRRKGINNQVVDHLSRLEKQDEKAHSDGICEVFPDERILAIQAATPWFADIVNYLALDHVVDTLVEIGQAKVLQSDYMYKWVEAMACHSNDAKTVVKFLQKHVFTRFGTPRTLISDEGTHFINRVLEEVLEKYNIQNRVATAYHPQTNGFG